MAEACECLAALVRLHDFFAAWYRGESTADLATLEKALAADFKLITPDAAIIDRNAVVAATAAKRGAFPDSQIRIDARHCTRLRGLHVSTYEEWQADDIERPARLSTAVLDVVDGDWRWHLVHETWLADARD